MKPICEPHWGQAVDQSRKNMSCRLLGLGCCPKIPLVSIKKRIEAVRPRTWQTIQGMSVLMEILERSLCQQQD